MMSDCQGHYNRVLLKLSGNALADDSGKGFENQQLDYIAAEIAEITSRGCALSIVLGAGNILRGAKLNARGRSRLLSDYAGMVATIVNGIVLREALERIDIPTHLCSAMPVSNAAEAFDSDLCRAELDKGTVVILAGGTGNPLFTTDTAAVLRAVQLNMQIVLKATRVNGVYSSDPETDSSSKLLPRLSYKEVLDKQLGIMDFAAIDLCREHKIPVRVFNFKESGNLTRAVAGESIGTFIGEQKNGYR